MVTALTAFMFIASFTTVLSLLYGTAMFMRPIRAMGTQVSVIGSRVSALASSCVAPLSIHPNEVTLSRLRGPRWAK
jgi:hypothetical protein